VAIIKRAGPLSDAWTRDLRLTYKDRGLLHAILTSREAEVSVPDLIRGAGDGAASVRAGLRDLQVQGYLVPVPERAGHRRTDLVLTEPKPAPSVPAASTTPDGGAVA
jgi:hypothetical protein